MTTGREHRALVQACRSLADQIDAQIRIGVFDDKAWREYRLALQALGEAVSDDGGPDSFAALTEKLRRTEIPHPQDA